MRWRELGAGARKRTRQPGSHLLVPSHLIRSWEWPHVDQESEAEDQLVAVEIEGNVPIGGGELLRRLLDDGRVIVVSPQIWSVILTIGPFEGDRYDNSWSYPTVEDAMEAAREWDGEGEPPGQDKPRIDSGDRLITSCFDSGRLPIVENRECGLCHAEVGYEHEPYCPVSEERPDGAPLPIVAVCV